MLLEAEVLENKHLWSVPSDVRVNVAGLYWEPAGGKQTKQATYGAFPAQVPEQALVLLRGEEEGADVSDPAGLRVTVHGSEFL